MKINISMDDELMKRIDDYADANYMSRSGLISTACVEFLNSKDLLLTMKEMTLAMKKIADKGEIDAETQEKLEDFERMCSMLMSH